MSTEAAAAGTGTGTEASTVTAPPAGTQGTTATPDTTTRTSAQPSGFTYQEDRSKWIPPHRLSEETTKRQALEAQIAERDRNIANALRGVAPADPAAAKAAEVKAAFLEMFPHLSEEEIDKRAAAKTAEVERREWKRHGDQQMDTVFSQIAETIGAESLSDDQKSDLQDSFASWLRSTCSKELQASDGQNSATLAAYENGDPKVLTAFIKRYTANWVEPARRKVTQQNLGRVRPVPNSTGRAEIASSVNRPESFKTIDERLDYAANLAKERGMTFGT